MHLSDADSFHSFCTPKWQDSCTSMFSLSLFLFTGFFLFFHCHFLSLFRKFTVSIERKPWLQSPPHAIDIFVCFSSWEKSVLEETLPPDPVHTDILYEAKIEQKVAQRRCSYWRTHRCHPIRSVSDATPNALSPWICVACPLSPLLI
jgi:hypothetical protein